MNFKWDNHIKLVLTAGKVSHVGGCVGQSVASRVSSQHSWGISFSVILLDITARETHQYIDDISVCNYFMCYSVHVEFFFLQGMSDLKKKNLRNAFFLMNS